MRWTLKMRISVSYDLLTNLNFGKVLGSFGF